ncbi:MAG: Do family serine endopeptidase [Pseudomonadota bacterium]
MTRSNSLAVGERKTGFGLRFAIVALVATVTVGASGSVLAQRTVPASKQSIQLSFAPVVRAAKPAVVNIFVNARIARRLSPFADDPVFRRFFGDDFGRPRNQSSLGSGVIVSADGLVVTNSHVIKSRGRADIRVVLADQRQFTARVLVQDQKTDIAILKLEGVGGRLPFLRVANSDAIEVGDLVLAIGNPFGVGQTVTSGIISALGRSQVGRSENQVFIQTDAAINPGNSGGALVDMQGRLVGINTAIFSQSGGSNGIGFAIPANLVALYVRSAETGRAVARVWIGADLRKVDRDIAASLGLSRVAGALVTQVRSGSPAARAGLRTGDVITAVEGREVADARGARYRLTTLGVGKSARLTVMRSGRERTVRMQLVAVPKVKPSDVRDLSGEHPFDGARVANLVPAIAEELNLTDTRGVVVVGLSRDGYAAGIGLRPGDIIVEVSGREITSLSALERLLRRRLGTWDIAIRRGGRVLRLRISG